MEKISYRLYITLVSMVSVWSNSHMSHCEHNHLTHAFLVTLTECARYFFSAVFIVILFELVIVEWWYGFERSNCLQYLKL